MRTSTWDWASLLRLNACSHYPFPDSTSGSDPHSLDTVVFFTLALRSSKTTFWLLFIAHTDAHERKTQC